MALAIILNQLLYLPNGITKKMKIKRYKRFRDCAKTLIFFNGGKLISVKGDARYIAFQLLEAMYRNKKMSEKTFQNIMRMKAQYVEQQRIINNR